METRDIVTVLAAAPAVFLVMFYSRRRASLADQLSRVDHTSHQQAAEVLGGTGPVLTTGDR